MNQFRYPTSRHGSGWITEIVAGSLPPDEDPESAIVREIREETGYEVDELRHVLTFYVSPGGTSERVFLFHAVVRGEPEPARGVGRGVGEEDIRVLELAPSELWEELRAGRLDDGKTVLALLWHRLFADGGANAV